MAKKKIIAILTLFILFIISIICVYFFTTKNKEENITGKVIISDDSYIIIESNNKDYLVKNIENKYQIGDEVIITYISKNINELSSPIEISAIKEEITKKASKEDTNTNELDQVNDNIINEEKNKTNNNTNNATNNNNNIIKDETIYQNNSDSQKENINIEPSNNNEETIVNHNADIEVLNYVKSIENDSNNGITSTLKSGFITIVDFLFYNGNIKGHTFNELTTKAKLEVLETALFIDKKIDEIFPDYKETISSSTNKIYTNIKNLIITTYLNITTRICNENDELCESTKENFQSLKNSFGFTWELIKDLAGNGISKLKEYYEIWSGK